MKKESLVSISKRTGYSISTISRVLNGQAEKYRISKKAVELISAEAKRCNYTPSLLAKGLRTRKTNTLGLIILNIDNPYFSYISNIVIHQAKEHGYTVILADSLENEHDERDVVRSLLSRQVDGIIAVPCGQDPSFLEDINKNSAPVVLIDRYYQNSGLPYVSTNNYQGGRMATEYFLTRGHKKIACICGTPYSMPSKERVRGYSDVMKNAGLESEIFVSGEDFSIMNGYLETKLLLNSKNKPTAIFTLSNTILLGAMKAINESGLKISEDISVISFDNNTYLDYMNPPITRIGQPTDEIGTLAVKIMLQSLEGKRDMETRILLPPELIERDSVSRIF
jgi:LacI family transcriptional regulator